MTLSHTRHNHIADKHGEISSLSAAVGDTAQFSQLPYETSVARGVTTVHHWRRVTAVTRIRWCTVMSSSFEFEFEFDITFAASMLFSDLFTRRRTVISHADL